MLLGSCVIHTLLPTFQDRKGIETQGLKLGIGGHFILMPTLIPPSTEGHELSDTVIASISQPLAVFCARDSMAGFSGFSNPETTHVVVLDFILDLSFPYHLFSLRTSMRGGGIASK